MKRIGLLLVIGIFLLILLLFLYSVMTPSIQSLFLEGLQVGLIGAVVGLIFVVPIILFVMRPQSKRQEPLRCPACGQELPEEKEIQAPLTKNS